MEYLTYLIGYWVVSFALFLRPVKQNRLGQAYQKYLNRKAVMHASHRGGSRDNVENTIQAFDHAVKQGTNCLEMDVCMSKDGKIVVVHDSNLLRICGVNQFVQDHNYQDLPPIAPQIRLDFAINEYLSTMNSTTKYMPLFEDVLKKFPDTLINVEIKTPTREVTQAVSDLIKKYNRESTIIWGARRNRILYLDSHQSDLLYQINPNISRFFPLERMLLIYLLYITGLLPFWPLKEASLQLPLFTNDFYRWKLAYAKTTSQKISVWIFHHFVWFLNVISAPLFRHLEKRGILVIYWVLNNQEEYYRARHAHGIMTDRPAHLKEYLIKNKLFN